MDEEPRGVFSIDKFTGKVSLNAMLDREKTDRFRVGPAPPRPFLHHSCTIPAGAPPTPPPARLASLVGGSGQGLGPVPTEAGVQGRSRIGQMRVSRLRSASCLGGLGSRQQGERQLSQVWRILPSAC